VTVLYNQGFEADDNIATVTKKAVAAGHKVTILAQDKPLLSLVSDKNQVAVYNPYSATWFNEAELWNELEITPNEAPHYMVLIGDSPRTSVKRTIPIAGPAQARKLLKEFKTMQNMYDKINSLPGPVKQKLLEHADDIKRVMKMATLRDDAPVPALAELAYRPPERDKVMAFLEKHNFPSLIQSIERNDFWGKTLPERKEKLKEGPPATKKSRDKAKARKLAEEHALDR